MHLPLQGLEPLRQGSAFVEEIRTCTPAPHQLACWYLGQNSVVWKAQMSTVWIDPYLSTNPARRYPPLCAPSEVNAADVVLITHEHSDHLDPASCAGIATASPQAIFVAPPVCGPRLQSAGVPAERIRQPRTGEEISIGPWRITPVPAAHEEVDYDPENGHHFTGYLAAIGEGVLYHAGDTVACDELVATLLPLVQRLSLAMLPINGRDYFRRKRNVLGNFTFREAAELAMRLGPALTVPLHYDLFYRRNDEQPGNFVDYVYERAPYLPVAVMAPGQCLIVPLSRPACGPAVG